MKSPLLLRQNAELKRIEVWNWSLPAWVTHLPDGKAFNVCPQAGACSKVCYALNGSYRFPTVREAHRRNLLLTFDTEEFVRRMLEELAHEKFRPTGEPRLPDLPRDHLHPALAEMLDGGCACVRIHDGGDFYSEDYLRAWVTIASVFQDTIFYAYTKSVTMFRGLLGDGSTAPVNFLWVYSLGGKEDHLLDLEVDRHAEVFPTEEALEEAGYFDQEENDLLCVLAPSRKIGIVANAIPSFRKKQGDKTFGQMEADLTRHGRKAHLHA